MNKREKQMQKASALFQKKNCAHIYRRILAFQNMAIPGPCLNMILKPNLIFFILLVKDLWWLPLSLKLRMWEKIWSATLWRCPKSQWALMRIPKNQRRGPLPIGSGFWRWQTVIFCKLYLQNRCLMEKQESPATPKKHRFGRRFCLSYRLSRNWEFQRAR